MKFKTYLLNESIIDNWMISIIKYPSNKAKKFLKQKWLEFQEYIKKENVEKEFLNIINKYLKTNYKSLNDINKINENEYLNEDFKHFWDFFKDNTWGAFSFYPLLNIWLEIDKLFSDTTPNLKKIGFYAIVFLIAVSTSHISQWSKWKKQNPEEFEKEGKPGPFTWKKI